jgi:hypothetical protein
MHTILDIINDIKNGVCAPTLKLVTLEYLSGPVE